MPDRLGTDQAGGSGHHDDSCSSQPPAKTTHRNGAEVTGCAPVARPPVDVSRSSCLARATKRARHRIGTSGGHIPGAARSHSMRCCAESPRRATLREPHSAHGGSAPAGRVRRTTTRTVVMTESQRASAGQVTAEPDLTRAWSRIARSAWIGTHARRGGGAARRRPGHPGAGAAGAGDPRPARPGALLRRTAPLGGGDEHAGGRDAWTTCATGSSARRRAAIAVAESLGLGLVAAGTVPLVDLESLPGDAHLAVPADARRLPAARPRAADLRRPGARRRAGPGRGGAVTQRVAPALPVLLALSASSPYWMGEDSRLRQRAVAGLAALADRRRPGRAGLGGRARRAGRRPDRLGHDHRPEDGLLRRPPVRPRADGGAAGHRLQPGRRTRWCCSPACSGRWCCGPGRITGPGRPLGADPAAAAPGRDVAGRPLRARGRPARPAALAGARCRPRSRSSAWSASCGRSWRSWATGSR